MASLVVFLYSERASFIDGAGVRIDSGSVFAIAS
jgi:hypothetical protein